MVIRLLLWIGFVARRHDGTIRWPFSAPPRWVLRECWKQRRLLPIVAYAGWKPYRFRNVSGVIKWLPGRLLPRRWGFGWLGFEFGDRG